MIDREIISEVANELADMFELEITSMEEGALMENIVLMVITTYLSKIQDKGESFEQ